MHIDITVQAQKNVNGVYPNNSTKTLSCQVESLQSIDVWVDNRLVSGIKVDKDGNVEHSNYAKVVGN